MYYNAKVKADALSDSAKDAAGNVGSQNDSIFALNGTLPKADVTGEDPLGLIRYKGAIRSAYTKIADGSTSVEYQALAPVNVVLSYYKTQLAKNNWILNSSTADKIVFSKGAQTATVTAATAKGVTTYTIVIK